MNNKACRFCLNAYSDTEGILSTEAEENSLKMRDLKLIKHKFYQKGLV